MSTRWSVSLFAFFLLLATGRMLAQQAGSPEEATPAIRVTTRLVLVEVIVTGKDGKPVTDLAPEDFALEDNGAKQRIAIFSLERPAAQAPLAALPPNIYSNRPQFNLPSGPLTILLIDGLNTPFVDQARARMELIRYAGEQQKPGQQTAVYALGNRLYKIQAFTSDPAVLQAAIAAFHPVSLPQHGSTLPPASVTSATEASGGGSTRPGALMSAAALQVSNLQTFANEGEPFLQTRIETTLAAMRAIARELAGRPGRKNLIWVSGGFPVSLVPETDEITYVNTRAADPTGPPPLPNEQTFGAYNQGIRLQSAEGVRRTAALLADSQIAIYPVDARGLVGSTADASASGTGASGLLMLGNDFGQSVSSQGARLEASQAGMQDLAHETGGRTLINRNDIDNAVALASSDGGTYYALGYYPEKKKFDGAFHKLKVSLDRPGVQARYRRGYYALDPTKTSPKDKEAELSAVLRNQAVQATQVLFDARVVPPPPAASMRVLVQFLVRTESITSEDAANGGRQLNLDFFAAAFTLDGKPAANVGQTVNTAVTAEQFAQIQQQGLLLPLEVPLPPGQYQLHLAVRDNRTGYFGTLTIPLDLSPAAPQKP